MPWKDAEKRRINNRSRYRNDPIYKAKENLKVIEWKQKHPEYHREYYQRNKDRMNKYANEYHEKLRRKLIMIVQGYVKCSLCDVDDIKILQLHHININGDEDRSRFTKNGICDKVLWLRHMIKHYSKEKDKYPLQVLCANCHIKRNVIDIPIARETKRASNLTTLTHFI